MQLREWSEALNTLLNVSQFKDYGVNGVQLEGTRPIQRVATAVTASLSAIQQAAAWQADALLVHHGLFWDGEPRTLVGIQRQRVHAALNAGLHVLAYHLPLDAHSEHGNNVLLGKKLQLLDIAPMSSSGEGRWVYQGRLPQALTPAQWQSQVEGVFGTLPCVLPGDPQRLIERVMWCSGGAQRCFSWAIAEGFDAFLTGEVSEYCAHQAQESGVHFIAAGHHATERWGVQSLGDYCVTRWGMEHHYCELEIAV